MCASLHNSSRDTSKRRWFQVCIVICEMRDAITTHTFHQYTRQSCFKMHPSLYSDRQSRVDSAKQVIMQNTQDK